jgi:uncharacterized membrane protein
MEKRLTGFATNLLLVLSVFIGFILFFETKLVIPPWLQSLGRMHPLLLHFPLVLLILSLLMDFFRPRHTETSGSFYDRFSGNLLLAGTVLAGVTVIMGLFLSHDDGYKGSVLNWHKWTGVSVFFFSVILCLVRAKPLYNSLVARSSAIILLLLLIVAGHYGAILTHGDNFILAPVTKSKKAEPVPADQAKIFEHVIVPILEAKCISCHNPEKAKGELILSDSTSIMKGGKSGSLFMPGQPDVSLLIKRLQLPVEDKKHMPPSGKAQLNGDEINLLALWLRSGASFHQKVMQYPDGDSLRMLAGNMLNSPSVEKQYEFPAADPGTVRQLNNDYRVIGSVASGSPALNVNIYNKDYYSKVVLEELLPLRKQIVSLNLSKMPVKDDDLSVISKFENLQRLTLTSTDVAGPGLKYLQTLKELETLSLSGTRVKAADLKPLDALTQLKTLSVWNTSISNTEMDQYRLQHKQIELQGEAAVDAQPLKLNLPQLGNAVTVFSSPVVLDLKHPVKGVELRYAMDTLRPDSIRSPVYEEGKIIVSKDSKFTVRAFKEGWIGSDAAVFSFYKSKYRPDSMAMKGAIYETNKGSGLATLFDNQLGDPSNFYSAKWLGISGDLEVIMKFDEPVMLSSIAFNIFQVPGAGMYQPASIELWKGDDPLNFKRVSNYKFPSGDIKKKEVRNLMHSFPPTRVWYMKIIIKPIASLPEGHSLIKKGGSPVLLLDEFLLN